MIFVGKKNSTSFFLLISLILGLALYTALFSSCVYEDLSKCSRMFMLQPRYLLHTGEGDRFGEAVHHIDVYAFDSLGIYRKMFRDKGAHLKNGYRMPIDLSRKKIWNTHLVSCSLGAWTPWRSQLITVGQV